jgi:uncharacterized MAPEG superfamily protein
MLLVASLLPIVAVAVAKAKGGRYDNSRPRDFLDNLPDNSMAKRMAWAQANSWEALMMFAPAVLLASMRGVNASTLNLLAGVFIAARLVYLYCYAKNLATARSLVWSIGLLCVIGLYIAAALAA